MSRETDACLIGFRNEAIDESVRLTSCLSHLRNTLYTLSEKMKQKKHETHKMLYDLIITTQLVAVERWQILEEPRYAGRGRYAPRRNGYTLSCRVAQCAVCGKKKIYSDWKNRVGIEILNNKILYE